MPRMQLPFNTNQPPEKQGLLTKQELFEEAGSVQASKWEALLKRHGVDPDVQGRELIGDCPFHDCPSFGEGRQKFTMNRQTAEWRCFVCGRQGNNVTFIREIHRNSFEQTTDHQRHELRKLRKYAIDMEEIMEMQLALNPLTNEWSLPAWNTEGKIVNLYSYREQFDPTVGKKFMQIQASPSFSHLPYGIHLVRSAPQRKLWVLEGHWDYLAMMGLMRRLKIMNEHDIVAAPGAGTFPSRYLSIFNGRSVIIAYDNDQAGEAGQESLLHAMAKASVMPLSVQHVKWPEALPPKFDVSDVIVKLPVAMRKKPKETK
jgi:CHC2 zinc finger/Toprim-like